MLVERKVYLFNSRSREGSKSQQVCKTRLYGLCFVSDYAAEYEEASTTALTDPAVAVPLLTINGWILMQRKVTGGSESFDRGWADYRDGFGSMAGNDNYWLGLEKLYRLMQMGSVRLRVEVCK